MQGSDPKAPTDRREGKDAPSDNKPKPGDFDVHTSETTAHVDFKPAAPAAEQKPSHAEHDDQPKVPVAEVVISAPTAH